jgi:tetratricopeptide (TPR) repeat protein
MTSATEDLPNFDDLWDYNNPAETEANFRDLVPLARSSTNQSYLAELLTQIARAQALQQHFDGATATLDEVESLLPDADGRARVRYLLERGRVYNSSHRQDEARPLFLEARDLAVVLKEDFYAVDAAHMMAIVEPVERQLEWSEWAIQRATQSDSPRARGWLGSLYNNTGWTYHDLGRYDDALAMFKKGLDWQTLQGKEAEARIAAWTVARTLRSLERYEEALIMQEQNLQTTRAAGGSDGYVNEELGECLLALDREGDARPHFARAYELLSTDVWLQRDQPERLQRLARLGGVPAGNR